MGESIRLQVVDGSLYDVEYADDMETVQYKIGFHAEVALG